MGTYKMKVVNVTDNLCIRSGPGTQYQIVGKRFPGSTFISDESRNVAGVDWYKEQGTNNWSASRSNTVKYLSIISVISSSTTSSSTANKTTPQPKKQVTSQAPKKAEPKKVERQKSDTKDEEDAKEKKISSKNTRVSGTSGVASTISDLQTGSGNMGIPHTSRSKQESIEMDEDDDLILESAYADNVVHADLTLSPGGTFKEAEKFFKVTKADYPKLTKLTRSQRKTNTQETHSGYIVDYALTIDDSILQSVERIKKNLNIPTAYTRTTINNYTHTRFNRFRMEFPDLYLKNTMGVIFFTRPDLNLFSTGTNIRSQIRNDPRDYYIILQNRDIGRLLTANGGEADAYMHHNFNPLLSNMAQSLEIQDDSVDTVDMGETFTGYKMQYAKHNIKSITAGQLSIKFKETYNLGITNMHQLWVDYQSNVYKGVFKPKTEHIWAKELDYACNIYYFLLDQDGETIRFWSKYYGCFPVNVPKSSFSFDSGSQVSFPELSVTYNYIYKSDLSPRTLVEFNHDGGDDSNLSYKYLPTYAGKVKDHSGNTWAGIPYVQSFRYDSGIPNPKSSAGVLGLKLRYRKASES